jgi:hypothetical protein
MKFISCQKWFLFEDEVNSEIHEYKTTDGKIFYYKSHASWEIVWNESLSEELKKCYNENMIG